MTDTVRENRRKTGLRVTRLLKGDKSVRRVAELGYTMGVVPEDGYLVETGTYFGGPVYLRDSALEAARLARERDGVKTTVEVRGWD